MPLFLLPGSELASCHWQGGRPCCTGRPIRCLVARTRALEASADRTGPGGATQARPWSTLVHTPSEPSGSQRLQRCIVHPGRRYGPGKRARVQNPDKDEVPDDAGARLGLRAAGAGRRVPLLPWPVTRSPLGALGEYAAAVRASRANGFAVVEYATGDPGHSLLTRERPPALDDGSRGWCGHQPGGDIPRLQPSSSRCDVNAGRRYALAYAIWAMALGREEQIAGLFRKAAQRSGDASCWPVARMQLAWTAIGDQTRVWPITAGSRGGGACSAATPAMACA